MARNHYELLGVDPIASQEEIDAALERRMKQFRVLTSQGRRPDPKALNRLREAHAALSDPKRRKAYDRKVLGLPTQVARSSRRAGGKRFRLLVVVALLLVVAAAAGVYLVLAAR
jgi:curved DNA-binding protein CbpA